MRSIVPERHHIRHTLAPGVRGGSPVGKREVPRVVVVVEREVAREVVAAVRWLISG